MTSGITYVGLDAHKKSISVALLLPRKRKAVEWTAANEPKAVGRMVKKAVRAAPADRGAAGDPHQRRGGSPPGARGPAGSSGGSMGALAPTAGECTAVVGLARGRRHHSGEPTVCLGRGRRQLHGAQLGDRDDLDDPDHRRLAARARWHHRRAVGRAQAGAVARRVARRSYPRRLLAIGPRRARAVRRLRPPGKDAGVGRRLCCSRPRRAGPGGGHLGKHLRSSRSGRAARSHSSEGVLVRVRWQRWQRLGSDRCRGEARETDPISGRTTPLGRRRHRTSLRSHWPVAPRRDRSVRSRGRGQGHAHPPALLSVQPRRGRARRLRTPCRLWRPAGGRLRARRGPADPRRDR